MAPDLVRQSPEGVEAPEEVEVPRLPQPERHKLQPQVPRRHVEAALLAVVVLVAVIAELRQFRLSRQPMPGRNSHATTRPSSS